jgi:protein-disulfide isomerase
MTEQITKKWYHKWWGIFIIGALIFLGIFSFAFAFQVNYFYKKIKSGELPSSRFTKTDISTSNPQASLALTSSEDSPFLGNPDAKLVIVEFSDFECPNSKEASPIVRELADLYKDNVKFVFRNFPLSEIHQDAILAAEAGDCADEQGKFWAMHDKMFQNQDKLTSDDLKFYAIQIGLDEKKFNDCLDSKKYQMKVTKDLLDGTAAGVSGTPTWFIESEKVEGVIPLDAFKKIIDYILK